MDGREGFSKGQKNMMCLSRETLDGLKITGNDLLIVVHILFYSDNAIAAVHSFVEMGKYLLEQDGVKYLFSERLCQDPVEAFFGKQRGCGGRNDNPNVKQFLENTSTLRVQGSVALDPVRGNCRKRKKSNEATIDEAPLPKRKRKH